MTRTRYTSVGSTPEQAAERRRQQAERREATTAAKLARQAAAERALADEDARVAALVQAEAAAGRVVTPGQARAAIHAKRAAVRREERARLVDRADLELIAPLPVDREPPADSDPLPYRSRAGILAARRAWQAEGQKSTAIHARLHTSSSTLIRWRHRLGLVPWPRD